MLMVISPAKKLDFDSQIPDLLAEYGFTRPLIWIRFFSHYETPSDDE